MFICHLKERKKCFVGVRLEMGFFLHFFANCGGFYLNLFIVVVAGNCKLLFAYLMCVDYIVNDFKVKLICYSLYARCFVHVCCVCRFWNALIYGLLHVFNSFKVDCHARLIESAASSRLNWFDQISNWLSDGRLHRFWFIS